MAIWHRVLENSQQTALTHRPVGLGCFSRRSGLVEGERPGEATLAVI